MSQLQGKQSPKRQLVQRVFPFVAHQAEFLVHIHLILAELVCPLGDAWHIIKFWRENRPFSAVGSGALPVRAYPRAARRDSSCSPPDIRGRCAGCGQAVGSTPCAACRSSFRIRFLWRWDTVSASLSQMMPVPLESMIFCRMPVPVLFPDMRNIRLRGNAGASDFSVPCPESRRQPFPAVSFIASFTSLRILSCMGSMRSRTHVNALFPRGGRAYDESLHTGGRHFWPYWHRTMWERGRRPVR